MADGWNQVLPRSLTNECKFIGKGATGWVFEVAPGITLKYLCTGRDDEFRRENEMYELIERSSPPPYFVQSFLRLPYAHFMQSFPDCLDLRLRSNRRQDPKTLECFEVLRLEPTAKIEQWAAELSSALAWLESLGLVQGDLRPSNILLDRDNNDHLKLVDFDSCAKIGDRDPGLPPPWSHSKHRFYGAVTEQFSFGSILYNMTRGLELYEDLGPEVHQLFDNMEFPELSDSRLDVLTRRCWWGEFATLADLAKECATLEGASSAATADTANDEYKTRMKRTCEELLRTKLADLGDESPRDVSA
ncbi:Serine/threonine-protein kinase Sgk1 [Beauveria bassiana]|uniref:Protein kinase domain-containing protein n=1 Tax=Beauveria bassiana (strain ARSEF 2860) TaxID=655819 RepID=J4UKX7_BEAB2|nr:protein kinase domain-containing protein [Beauveria bassiana ARSEF 2860]EJP65022.1 protein kinase domain-containing protein [Beauveria bassiana ARSEF 2860]KAF1732335.1 Serine/threonine-protein kinase Sgk1 [Beauveria bassiana]KAH8716610.1 Serine/threonine-protein kinase Sgk1 [Beauveria bassiana]